MPDNFTIEFNAIPTPDGRFVGQAVVTWHHGGGVSETYVDGEQSFATAEEAAEDAKACLIASVDKGKR